jgi:hypothetical protein
VTERRTKARLAAACAAAVLALSPACSRSALPESLSNADFWNLSASLSEPPGTFDLSENLVSNEPLLVENVRRLPGRGGVYIGVGPEQNFSYIARLRPSMAFIVDIRRENLDLHLLYKALFELANDRADFVSRLFSRPRPAGLGPASSVDEIFQQIGKVTPVAAFRDETLSLVRERLMTTRGFALPAETLAVIERALMAFHTDGLDIDFWRGRPPDPEAIRPSYRELMTARDVTGAQRSVLAREDGFAFVKALHTKNLIVPVVGNFAGPSALRGIGEYVRARGDSVQAFYASNVTAYLSNQQMRTFCATLASLPASPLASFINREDVKPLSAKIRSCR